MTSCNASSSLTHRTCCGAPSPTCSPGRGLYLAAFQRVFSRRTVGWQIPEHMHTRAVRKRSTGRRAPSARPGLIHHPDQGGRNSCLWTSARAAPGLRSSGRWDPKASPGTLSLRRLLRRSSKEFVYRRSWPIRRKRETEIFEYIEGFCNRRGRRDALPDRLRARRRRYFVLSGYPCMNMNNNSKPTPYRSPWRKR
jgi:hypothetical protein